jgi:hypothetical protein
VKTYHGTNKGFADPDRHIYVEKASNDWLLCVDADERFSQKSLERLDDLTRSGDYTGYYFPRRNYYAPNKYYHHVQYPDYQLRLYNRKYLVQMNDGMHTAPILRGRTRKLYDPPYYINHLTPLYSDRTKYKKWAGIHNKELDYKHRELLKIRAPFKAIRSLSHNLANGCFLDGLPGIGAAVDEALYTYWVHAE